MSELLERWEEIGVIDAAQLLRGVTYSKADVFDVPSSMTLPVLRANNIGNRRFNFDDLVHVRRELISSGQKLRAGDVVVATSSGSISVVGKAAQTYEDMDMAFGAFCGLLRPHEMINYRYFGHFFSTQIYRRTVSSLARGVNINNLKREHFESLRIPFAPLAEQKRIADKLDALLARVDACRERLDRVPLILKRFRQAVLSAAVEGRLTEEWRDENIHIGQVMPSNSLSYYDEFELDKLPLSWSWQRLGDVASIESNLVAPSEYQNFPHIAPNHIESETGRLLPYETVASDKVISANHLFKPGQVIYSKIRPYLCKAVVVDFAGLCSADMYPIRGHRVSSQFLHKWMITKRFTDFASSQQGRTVLPKINQSALNEIPVPVPPLLEQHEIVRRVESLFAIADRLEARYTAARAQVDKLTPSLLAKAFRGELVPQDPNDEPASTLLARIRAERETAAQSTQATLFNGIDANRDARRHHQAKRNGKSRPSTQSFQDDASS